MIWTRVLAVKNGSDEKLSDSAFIVKVKSIVFADKLHVVTKKERERGGRQRGEEKRKQILPKCPF